MRAELRARYRGGVTGSTSEDLRPALRRPPPSAGLRRTGPADVSASIQRGRSPLGRCETAKSDSYHVLGDRMVVIGDEANAATSSVAQCSEPSRDYEDALDCSCARRRCGGYGGVAGCAVAGVELLMAIGARAALVCDASCLQV